MDEAAAQFKKGFSTDHDGFLECLLSLFEIVVRQARYEEAIETNQIRRRTLLKIKSTTSQAIDQTILWIRDRLDAIKGKSNISRDTYGLDSISPCLTRSLVHTTQYKYFGS